MSESNVEPDRYLSTTQTAKQLHLTPRQVRDLIRQDIIKAEKQAARWRIPLSEIERYRTGPQQPVSRRFLIKDTGILEISVGLTGASTAILALVPSAVQENKVALVLVYFISVSVSLLSLYTSLWFLGEYVEDLGLIEVREYEDSLIGRGHIYALMTNTSIGPYWLLAVTLTFLVLAIVIASIFLIIS